MAGSDIYSKRQWWKLTLALIGLVIVLITMFYARHLANHLAQNEENNVKLYVEVLKSNLNSVNTQDDVGIELFFLEMVENIPIITENEAGILSGNNFPEGKNEDQEFLQQRKKAFLNSGKEPIEGFGYASHVYYENSKIYDLINYFPIVQVLLLSAFIGLGYFFFSTTRKAEQNRVWAGMAKETAHQLGTPISAILAWINHLEDLNAGNEEQLEIIAELSNDVDRLGLIADRFSKIGSAPKLTPINVYDELEECRQYMEKRAAKKVSFHFPEDRDENLMINVNKHLFDWVIENLIRNSLDAMGAVGTITAEIYEDDQYINIDITDSGKGIPSSKFKTVFQPGFTTKTRGWGLGLSLAKRIIEDYHKGRIFVKQSKINEGTTFAIRMPKA